MYFRCTLHDAFWDWDCGSNNNEWIDVAKKEKTTWCRKVFCLCDVLIPLEKNNLSEIHYYYDYTVCCGYRTAITIIIIIKTSSSSSTSCGNFYSHTHTYTAQNSPFLSYYFCYKHFLCSFTIITLIIICLNCYVSS